MLCPQADGFRWDGVFGVEEALDGAGEGGVLAVIESELCGAKSEIGIETGGVATEEVVYGSAGLIGGDPGVDKLLVGDEVVRVLLQVTAPENRRLHGGEVLTLDLKMKPESGKVVWILFEAMFQEAAGAVGILFLKTGFC